MRNNTLWNTTEIITYSWHNLSTSLSLEQDTDGCWVATICHLKSSTLWYHIRLLNTWNLHCGWFGWRTILLCLNVLWSTPLLRQSRDPVYEKWKYKVLIVCIKAIQEVKMKIKQIWITQVLMLKDTITLENLSNMFHYFFFDNSEVWSPFRFPLFLRWVAIPFWLISLWSKILQGPLLITWFNLNE